MKTQCNLNRMYVVVIVFFAICAIGESAPVALAADAPPEKVKPLDAGLKEKASEVFAKSLKRYRELESYRDTSSYSSRMVYLDEDGKDQGMNQESTVRFAAARPNRFSMKSNQMSMASDGRKLVLVAESMDRYVEFDAPAGLELPEDLAMQVGPAQPMAVIQSAMVRRDADFWALYPDIKEVTAVEEVRLNDSLCMRIDMKSELPMLQQDALADVSVWIDQESSLLKRVEVDFTEGFEQMQKEMREAGDGHDPFDGMKLDRAVTTLIIDKAELNPRLTDDDFKVELSANAEKFPDFMSMLSPSDQYKLVGKPAPAFESKDFHGKSVKLSDFKGKVIVLDFWATWCGPCVQALPHVQETWEKMKDESVVILGVNRDAVGSESRVKDFLEKKKITFRQVEDFSGDIANAYRVSGIPCTVIIGADGLVQDIQVGFGPGMEDMLGQKIGKLLKGERLFDPDAVVEDTAPMDDGEQAIGARLADIHGERLVVGERLSGVQQFLDEGDIDGDGVDDYIFNSNSGKARLCVIHGGKDAVENVELEGGKSRESPAACSVVRLDGKPMLAVLLVRYSFSGESSCRFGLFQPDGKQEWIIDIETPEGKSAQASLQVANINGDPDPEFVLSLMCYSMRQTSPGSFRSDSQSNHLLVVDRGGKLLARKSMGDFRMLLHILPGDPPKLVITDMNGARLWTLADITDEASPPATKAQSE